jgi:hypothetical protein
MQRRVSAASAAFIEGKRGVTIEEVLWLFLGALLGVVVAGAMACVFLGIGSLLRLRRANLSLATATTRRPTNSGPTRA